MCPAATWSWLVTLLRCACLRRRRAVPRLFPTIGPAWKLFSRPERKFWFRQPAMTLCAIFWNIPMSISNLWESVPRRACSLFTPTSRELWNLKITSLLCKKLRTCDKPTGRQGLSISSINRLSSRTDPSPANNPGASVENCSHRTTFYPRASKGVWRNRIIYWTLGGRTQGARSGCGCVQQWGFNDCCGKSLAVCQGAVADSGRDFRQPHRFQPYLLGGAGRDGFE